MSGQHTLFPHQVEALDRIRGNPRPALFMEMRLGKTPVIIRWAKDRVWNIGRRLDDPPHRILTVGPMSVLDDWQEELRRERIRPIIPLYAMNQQERHELMEGGTGWYLINYEGVRVTPEIADLPWDVVIVDESTGIRSPKAKITKLMTHIFAHVPYRAILTGNPAPEGLLDYFTQFLFLHGNFMNFGNYWVFRNRRFVQNRFLKWQWNPEPGLRDEVKAYVHEKAVVMTRQQCKVGGTFAPIQRRIIEPNAAQIKAAREISWRYSYEYIQTNFATVRDIWLARVAGGFSPDRENPELLSGAKAQELVQLLQGELRSQPVVIWFRFNEELAHVVEVLNQKKIPAMGVTGATPQSERRAVRQAFTRGQYQALCVQVQLGKFGWDLSHARTAIRYSNAYDLESYSQSKERIVHPMKTDPLLEIHLVTRGTLDEDVFRALRKKHTNSRAFMRELNSATWARILRRSHGQDQTTTERAFAATHRNVHRIYPGTAGERQEGGQT